MQYVHSLSENSFCSYLLRNENLKINMFDEIQTDCYGQVVAKLKVNLIISIDVTFANAYMQICKCWHWRELDLVVYHSQIKTLK